MEGGGVTKTWRLGRRTEKAEIGSAGRSATLLSRRATGYADPGAVARYAAKGGGDDGPGVAMESRASGGRAY
jgi:hypothetical protein